MKNIVIGADHRGYALKEYLISCDEIGDCHISWIDVGTDGNDRADYPKYAEEAIDVLLSGDAELGILLCGTGVGMSIAANRFRHIYASLAWNEEVAQRAREEDNANVLVLPADYLDTFETMRIVHAWLQATFHGERYQYRIEQLDSL